MVQYYKTYELKDRAKDALRGNYRLTISIFLLFLLIRVGVNLLISSLATPFLTISSVEEEIQIRQMIVPFLFSSLFSFAIACFLGFFTFGLVYYMLKLACNQPCSQQDLFYAFRQDTKKVLMISAVQAGITLLFLSMGRFYFSYFQTTGATDSLYKAAFATLLGFLLYLPIGLSLDLAFYFLLDFPEKTAGEIIGLCLRYTKGHRMRLFLMALSFLPVMLLGVLTLYVGFLWILPYMQMTYTQFYLDLMNPKKNGCE